MDVERFDLDEDDDDDEPDEFDDDDDDDELSESESLLDELDSRFLLPIVSKNCKVRHIKFRKKFAYVYYTYKKCLTITNARLPATLVPLI